MPIPTTPDPTDPHPRGRVPVLDTEMSYASRGNATFAKSKLDPRAATAYARASTGAHIDSKPSSGLRSAPTASKRYFCNQTNRAICSQTNKHQTRMNWWAERHGPPTVAQISLALSRNLVGSRCATLASGVKLRDCAARTRCLIDLSPTSSVSDHNNDDYDGNEADKHTATARTASAPLPMPWIIRVTDGIVVGVSVRHGDLLRQLPET
jgi:hypothetical protein